MPVTAKLSRRFYDRFGDEITNELVDWFNAVDATYRSDLRETNEANFGRFMASVDQRFAEQDARFEKRFAEQDVKLEKRLAEQETRFDKRLVELEAKLEKRFVDTEAGLERRFCEILNARIADLRSDLMKWMFIYWSGTVVAMAGLVFAVLQRR